MSQTEHFKSVVKQNKDSSPFKRESKKNPKKEVLNASQKQEQSADDVFVCKNHEHLQLDELLWRGYELYSNHKFIECIVAYRKLNSKLDKINIEYILANCPDQKYILDKSDMIKFEFNEDNSNSLVNLLNTKTVKQQDESGCLGLITYDERQGENPSNFIRKCLNKQSDKMRFQKHLKLPQKFEQFTCLTILSECYQKRKNFNVSLSFLEQANKLIPNVPYVVIRLLTQQIEYGIFEKLHNVITLIRNLLVKPSFHDGNLYDNAHRVNRDWYSPDQLICLLIQFTIHEYDHNILVKQREFVENHWRFNEIDAAVIVYIFEGLSGVLINEDEDVNQFKNKVKQDQSVQDELYKSQGRFRGIKGQYIINQFILHKFPIEKPRPKILDSSKNLGRYNAGMSLFITMFKFMKRIKWHTRLTKNLSKFNEGLKKIQYDDEHKNQLNKLQDDMLKELFTLQKDFESISREYKTPWKENYDPENPTIWKLTKMINTVKSSFAPTWVLKRDYTKPWKQNEENNYTEDDTVDKQVRDHCQCSHEICQFANDKSYLTNQILKRFDIYEMVYNQTISLDVAEDFEFEVQKIGNTQDKLIKMKEKKIREKQRYNLKKDKEHFIDQNDHSESASESLDRMDSNSSATMLNYETATANELTVQNSNLSNRDTNREYELNEQAEEQDQLMKQKKDEDRMKGIGKLLGRQENNGLDNISEMSMDEFKTKSAEVATQTEPEFAKISLLDNHDEYCLCKHCRVYNNIAKLEAQILQKQKKIQYRRKTNFSETEDIVNSILTTVKSNIMEDSNNLKLNESDKKLYDLATAGHENQINSSLIEHENILARLEKLKKIIYNACKVITKHIQYQCPVNQDNVKNLMIEIFQTEDEEHVQMFDKLYRDKIVDDRRFDVEKTIIIGQTYLKKIREKQIRAKSNEHLKVTDEVWKLKTQNIKLHSHQFPFNQIESQYDTRLHKIIKPDYAHFLHRRDKIVNWPLKPNTDDAPLTVRLQGLEQDKTVRLHSTCNRRTSDRKQKYEETVKRYIKIQNEYLKDISQKKKAKIAVLKDNLMLDIFPNTIFLCGVLEEKYEIHKQCAFQFLKQMEEDDYKVTPANIKSVLHTWHINLDMFINNKFKFKDVNFEIPKVAITQLNYTKAHIINDWAREMEDMETNQSMKKSTDSFMKDKMEDLVKDDEYFTKWWNESKLEHITGKISNDFDHKKNWSKYLDDNVRENESLLDQSDQIEQDAWTKFKIIDYNSKLNDDLGLILHKNNSNHDNVNHDLDNNKEQGDGMGISVDNANVVSNDNYNYDRMQSVYTINTENVHDQTKPKQEDIIEAIKKRELKMTTKSEKIQNKWLQKRKEDNVRIQFKRNCKMKGSFMVVEQ